MTIRSFQDFLSESAPVPPAKPTATPTKINAVLGKDQITYTHGNLSFTVTRAEFYNALLTHIQSGFYQKHENEFNGILKKRVRSLLHTPVKAFIESKLADPNIQKGMADLFASFFMVSNPLFAVGNQTSKYDWVMGDFPIEDRLHFSSVAPKVTALARTVVASLPAILRPFIVVKDADITNPAKIFALWDDQSNLEIYKIIQAMLKTVLPIVVLPKAAAVLKTTPNKLRVVINFDFEAFY